MKSHKKKEEKEEKERKDKRKLEKEKEKEKEKEINIKLRDEYLRWYEVARFSNKEFTRKEYLEFMDCFSQLLKKMQ